MNKKLFGTVFAAAVMLAGTLETYGGENMKSELLTVRKTAIVDLGAAVARGDQKNLAAITGGIALAFYKEMPQGIIAEIEKRLPHDMIEICEQFSDATGK